MLKDEDINSYIKTIYEKVCNEYGEDNILGVFPYGKVLYGFAKTIDDIKYMVSYVPSFDDLCFNEINYIGLNDDNIADIRLEMNNFQNQDLKVMECVFSPYSIINPKYKKIYNNKILMNREQLFHYKKQTRIKNAISRGYKALEEKNYFEAARIQIAVSLYLKGTSIENCINIKDNIYLSYLKSIIEGFIPNENEIKDNYERLLQETNEIEETYSATNTIAKDFIKEIIKTNINNNNTTDDFYNSLTKSEKIAWKEIIMEINNYYGIISISQMVEKSEVSRPVFKSTLDKMEKYGMAEIVNMGVKGTQITMLK